MPNIRMFVQFSCSAASQETCKDYMAGFQKCCVYGMEKRICHNEELRFKAVEKYLKKIKYFEWLENKNGKEADTENSEEETETTEA